MVKSSLLTNFTYFYTFVNDKRKPSHFPASMSFDGSDPSDGVEISIFFTNFFQLNCLTEFYGATIAYQHRVKGAIIISNITFCDGDLLQISKPVKHSNSSALDNILHHRREVVYCVTLWYSLTSL